MIVEESKGSIHFTENLSRMPAVFEVQPAYPNPGSETTFIPMQLPEAGRVTLVVYNMLGEKVINRTQQCSAGSHRWEVNHSDHQLSAGTYFVQVRYGGDAFTQKLIISSGSR